MCSYDFNILKSGQFDPRQLCEDEKFLQQFQDSSQLYTRFVAAGGDELEYVFRNFSFNELVIVSQKFLEYLIALKETECSEEAHLRCFNATISAVKLIRAGTVKFKPNWDESEFLDIPRLSEFFGTLQSVLKFCTPNCTTDSDRSEPSLLLVKYSIHVVSNFSTLNENNAKRMLTLFGRQFVETFRTFSCDVAFSSQFLCSLHRCLHNCRISSWHEAVALLDENSLGGLCHAVLSQLVTDGSDSPLQSFDTFKMMLRWYGFVSSMWHELSIKERLFIVEVLRDEAERLDSEGSLEKLEIPEDSGRDGKIACLPELFHRSRIEFLCELEADEMSSIIAGDKQADGNEDYDLFHPLLALLYVLSQYFHVTGERRTDAVLLSKTIELLRVLQPSVPPKKTFSRSESTSSGQTKTELVGLIGNLVYKNRTNQDLAREVGGLQLLLNMTYIDESCPTVQQWSLLAIRNLLEGNEENQNFISGLKLERVDQMSEQLKELGLKAEVKDGRLNFSNDKRK